MSGSRRSVIVHSDCNNFFAEAELLKYPHLRACPVAVAGDPSRRHGIILAKNELAKQYGIKTAETVYEARAKCRSLVLLPAHMQEYRDLSRKIVGIYRRFSPQVEIYSIDECFIDLTDSWHLFGASPREAALCLRRRVEEESGCTVSLGISFNKIFAKIASDQKRPDGLCIFEEDELCGELYSLPISDMIQVGRRTAAELERINIRTIGDLASASEDLLLRIFGKHGLRVHRASCASEISAAEAGRESVTEFAKKSVSASHTFPRDLVTEEEIFSGLAQLLRKLLTELRAEGRQTSLLSVFFRDRELRTYSRQSRLQYPCSEFSALWELSRSLLRALNPQSAVRLLGVSLAALSDTEKQGKLPLSLCGGEKAGSRRAELDSLLEQLQTRYGEQSIAFGADHRHTVRIS